MSPWILTLKLLRSQIILRSQGQIRKFRYQCLWNNKVDTDMKIMRPRLLIPFSLSPSTESCLLSGVGPRAILVSSSDKYCHYKCSWLTDQASHWSDRHRESSHWRMLASSMLAVLSLLLAIGHTGRTITMCHQISSPHIEMLSPWEQFGFVQRWKLAVTQSFYFSKN